MSNMNNMSNMETLLESMSREVFRRLAEAQASEGRKLPATSVKPYLLAEAWEVSAGEEALRFRRRGSGGAEGQTLGQEGAERYSAAELRALGVGIAGEDFPWQRWREQPCFGVRAEDVYRLGLHRVTAWMRRKEGRS